MSGACRLERGVITDGVVELVPIVEPPDGEFWHFTCGHIHASDAPCPDGPAPFEPTCFGCGAAWDPTITEIGGFILDSIKTWRATVDGAHGRDGVWCGCLP